MELDTRDVEDSDEDLPEVSFACLSSRIRGLDTMTSIKCNNSSTSQSRNGQQSTCTFTTSDAVKGRIHEISDSSDDENISEVAKSNSSSSLASKYQNLSESVDLTEEDEDQFSWKRKHFDDEQVLGVLSSNPDSLSSFPVSVSESDSVTGSYMSADTQCTSSQNSYTSVSTGKSGCSEASTKSKAMLKKEERENLKQQKQLQKEANQRLREEKRAEKERINAEKRQQKEQEKLIKRTLAESRKNAKPGECCKLINVSLDPGIAEGLAGGAILMSLQQLDVRYFIEHQRVQNSITWTREVTDLVQKDQNQLVSVTTEESQDHVLVAVSLEDFVNMVHASKPGSFDSCGFTTMKSFVIQQKQQLPDKIITFYVMGFEKYLRDKKNVQQRKHRDEVSGQSSKNKRMKTASVDITVSRLDVEQALVEVQLCTDCNVRFVETAEDVGKLVLQFTKAIAEAPYKQERLKTGFSFHIDSSGSVKVDKDGHGLTRVWRQQIQQFKNVSAEIANTILAKYPSPRSLYLAYKECATEKEASLLLQDLVVRRGAGVTETTRRVGKELSQRMHQLMTSTEPCDVIK